MIGLLAFIYPFDRPFMRMALVAGVAVGVCAPLIGTFLVQRRLSLLGDGIGHIAFAGVAAGVFAGCRHQCAAGIGRARPALPGQGHRHH